MTALLIGVLILLAVNLIRLISLFSIGVDEPELFELAHNVLWRGVMIATVAILWLSWSAWVRGRINRITSSLSRAR